MPTYGYRCGTCRHEFEQVQRMSDDTLTECPECGGAIRRVVHPVGVVFKGSGWYITDSRKPAPSENGGSDKTSDKGDKAESGKSKDAVAAKANDTSGGGNGKEPAATTAKTAKTPTKAAAE